MPKAKLQFASVPVPAAPKVEGPRQAFGDWLVEARTDLNLSQEQLAEAFGCHPSTIRRWEIGERRCTCPGAVELAIESLRRRTRKPK